MWPFSKKNRSTDSSPSTDADKAQASTPEADQAAATTTGAEHTPASTVANATGSSASPSEGATAASGSVTTETPAVHEPATPVGAGRRGDSVAEGVDNVLTALPEAQLFDGITSQHGPYDSRRPDIESIDLAKMAPGVLNLGSMQLGLPGGAEVQVEVNQQTRAPQAVHIVTPAGRITPAIFAAPRSGGLWEDQIRELAPQLAGDGFTVSIEEGPWGTELVGRNGDGHVRLVGVNGRGWMVRFFSVGPEDKEEQLIDFVHGIVSRTVIHRGDAPMPAGQPMQVSLPRDMAEALQNAIEQEQQQQAQAAAAQTASNAAASAPHNGKASTSAADVANAFAKRNSAPKHGNGQTAALRSTSALDELDGRNDAR